MSGHRTMITNNSNRHPNSKWALETARTLIVVEDSGPEDDKIDAQELQAKVARALMPHYEALERQQVGALATDLEATLASPLDPTDDEIAAAVADVKATMATSRWSDVLATQAGVDILTGILHSHFSTHKMVERQAHVQANPTHDATT
jgi:polysaccharide deacetylase 2 family uncharacterized protein YibQ